MAHAVAMIESELHRTFRCRFIKRYSIGSLCEESFDHVSSFASLKVSLLQLRFNRIKYACFMQARRLRGMLLFIFVFPSICLSALRDCRSRFASRLFTLSLVGRTPARKQQFSAIDPHSIEAKPFIGIDSCDWRLDFSIASRPCLYRSRRDESTIKLLNAKDFPSKGTLHEPHCSVYVATKERQQRRTSYVI